MFFCSAQYVRYVRPVRAYAKQDDAMAGLRNAIFFRPDDEILRRDFAQQIRLIAHQRKQLVTQWYCLIRLGNSFQRFGKISPDFLKDTCLVHGGGQHALNIFHYEHRRSVHG
ncbi:hypothetical protein AW736_13125 [Termitidicoccus mucosus]|uniref:Uncharacterized protein n=1 Tax=Termitidicoccus mucosus TaxID=1184151 RepID=A0A178IJH6_9BACT|nr:hypothetical protein AW736_13125 [Opitutaceae bacterium TSB47]